MLNPSRSCVGLLLSVSLASGCGSYDVYEGERGAPSMGRPGAYADAGAARLDEDGTDPAEPGGDRYEYVGTNPFTLTGHDPYSTFAADVDTASYDIFVRDVERGLLPDRASVRLEEHVNSFAYDYLAPETGAEVPFAIDLAAATHPFRPEIAQLRVGIQASRPPEFVKVPTNLVYLVDTSGSMASSNKLPLAQQVLRHSLDVLGPHDTVSIVSYAGDVAVRLAPTSVSDRARIEAAIDGLTSGGGTAGASGIHLAYEQAQAGFIEGGFNHVVLCTDGDFNIGISDTESLVALIEEKRRTGVTLTALGFGSGNLNDAMMEQVTNAGNGVYSVIVSEEHAERYARERLLHTAHFVAQDMKIQVEFNPEHVVAYRLLGYENRAIADSDFRVDTVDAGEVGAGHRVTALYELVLVGQTVPDREGAPEVTDGEPVDGERTLGAEELVRVRVRWKDVGASEEDSAYETGESLAPSAVADRLDPVADRDFLWASAIAAFAEILKDSPYADIAHLDAIEEIVRAQATRDEERTRFERHFQRARVFLAGG